MSPASNHGRLSERLDWEIEVDIESDSNFYTGFSTNVSDGGVFIATYRHHELGQRLHVQLRLPGLEQAIDATVEVRWVRDQQPGSDVSPGFGAAFIELSADARAHIERFTRHREPLFHDED